MPYLINVANLLILFFSAETPPYFFNSTSLGEYLVDTGVVKGVFRQEGKSLGFEPLKTTSPELTLSHFPGILNFYRVFKANYRFPHDIREMKSEAKLLNNRSIEVIWESSSNEPFELRSVYKWVDPQTLDLLVSVKALAELPKFEIFLSSYLTENFPEPYVYVKSERGKYEFVSTPRDIGVWHAFPRDEEAVKIIQDGRWSYPPSPVDWVIREYFAEPIIYRKDKSSGLTILQMASKENCFSIMAPHIGEAHFSMYFSLFGKDLMAGQIVNTRIRMVIGNISEEEMLRIYRNFSEE